MSDATKTAEQVAYEIVTGLGLRADDDSHPDVRYVAGILRRMVAGPAPEPLPDTFPPDSAIRVWPAPEPVKPPATKCKRWCGTGAFPTKSAYYQANGVYYCTESCAHVARTPAAGTAPKGER